MSEKEYVSAQDLTAISKAKTRVGFLALKAEKAITDHQLSEAEHKNTILSVYVKYKMGEQDTIDEGSGEIVRFINVTDIKTVEKKEEVK